MKRLPVSRPLVALLLGVFAVSAPVMAQSQYKLDVDKPKFDDLQSPEVGGNTGKKNFKPKDWLEVEVKFKITSSNKKEKFADRVTVRWYVAAKVSENGKTQNRVLEKEVNFVNVPIGEDVYASVYLSPSAVRRISGSDNAGKGVVESVGGEILVNGSPGYKNSGFFSSKGRGKWWDSMARYNKIPLRNKNETPFKFLWWDRYAEIQERR
ncbi:MAG: Amuc_1102 family pilus-like protein [Akkermansiaceae bacterium]